MKQLEKKQPKTRIVKVAQQWIVTGLPRCPCGTEMEQAQ